MPYCVATLGTTIVRSLQQRSDTPIVVIGKSKYTRRDLAANDSFNYIAAAHLSAVIKTLNVDTTKDLYLHHEPSELAVPGIGSYAYAVLDAIFGFEGIGTLDSWVQRSLKKGTSLVTVSTIKQRIKRDTTKTVARTRTKKNGKA
jgi:hypothetical protein